jgi:bifunctional non-homologous end joining protein LigD
VAKKPDKLAKYQSMRDFGVTAEPARNEKVKPSKQLRFVIQKHAATRLHYDLRLEYEGVFLSWAVTKGPSLDPKDRRLAVEVEPHPLDYGDFEGTIPKGQYGGGTVMLWDRGYWAPEPGTTIEQGLKKGDLKVVFAGERMKGSWVLVRMRWDREKSGGKRNNWLLIKHHDGYEKEGDDDALLEKNAFSVASGRTMEEIAAGKGKRPSPFMTAVKRAADAVWQSNREPSPEDSAEEAAVENDAPKAKASDKPKPLAHGRKAKTPPFVPPQLAKLVDRPPVGGNWAHEIKFDGYRLQLRVEGGKARLLTRKGLDWSDRFKEIAADGSKLPDGVYDGEAVALDDQARPDFAGLQDALSTGRTSGLVFYVFDAMFSEGEDLRSLPLEDRKARLRAVMAAAPASPRLRYVDHFQSSGEAVLNSACHMHLEGIISKRLDAPYQSGRGDTWVKSKCRGGQEVVVAGYTTTGTAFRSLIAGVYRDGRLIHVGRIGTGFGREKLAKLLPRLKALETDQNPFSGPGAPRKAANVRWLKPELVAEIEFAGWTGDGHIRQASFKALREDKSATDVVAEGQEAQAKVEKDAEAQGAAEAPVPPPPGRKGGPSVIRGVSISNPDKPLWPDDGQGQPVRKLEMAQYLDAVSGWMLPHIKGRPCSIIRTPDGIEGKQHFFQRHAGRGTSSLITQVTVSGDREPYIQIDTPEALIAAAQSGATEYHPWNCAPDRPDMPGRLVFDLDPSGELGFDAVIEGALEIKERLEALGLVTFCKTTGGKGLHVVTPLKPSKIDWPTAKAFARAVCEEMAADRPDRYLVNMAKAKRTGKIFLDYLRNDRMSTAVAPLSPRARPGAPVSFPLNWTQVRKGLDPKRFNIRTAPGLLAKTTDWEGYCDGERSLETAIRTLAKNRKRAA